MKILNAKEIHIDIVKNITYQTIKVIYPHYYTSGVVIFFLSHHSEDNIIADIKQRRVFLITDDKFPVGTVTIKENEICRLFVLPEFQRMGFGKHLMDFAENQIWKRYDNIQLDSSLAAQDMYLRRGYNKIESRTVQTEQGDFLYYDVMQKNR